MQDLETQEKQTIVLLEHFKKRMLAKENCQELVHEIDNCLEYLLHLNGIDSDIKQISKTGLHPTFNHLREMKKLVLESQPSVPKELAHEINLALGVIQFEMWAGQKEELYQLLDAVG